MCEIRTQTSSEVQYVVTLKEKKTTKPTILRGKWTQSSTGTPYITL